MYSMFLWQLGTFSAYGSNCSDFCNSGVQGLLKLKPFVAANAARWQHCWASFGQKVDESRKSESSCRFGKLEPAGPSSSSSKLIKNFRHFSQTRWRHKTLNKIHPRDQISNKYIKKIHKCLKIYLSTKTNIRQNLSKEIQEMRFYTSV